MTRVAAAAALLGALAATAHAGLPCLVDGTGRPLRWRMPVAYHLDGSALGVDGAELVEAATAAWTGVDTASVAFAPGPPIPYVVDARNAAGVLGRCGDGLSPIVFDPGGDVIDALLGEGASQVVLGITMHDCDTDTTPDIPEASVVISGAVYGFSGAAARATQVQVLVHELGHVLNLCHTRLNAALVDDGNAANDAFVPIMFPSHSEDVATPDPTPRFDDRTMVSALYPAADFFAATGSLGGHVLSGVLPVSGAAVVVRSVADPMAQAAWTTTGWLRLEGGGDLGMPVGQAVPAIDGSWQAPGLPAGDYSVEVPAGAAGAPGEFFSGDGETSDPVTDPPSLSVPVAVTAGASRTDVTVRLAERVRSPLSETDWTIAWRGRLVAGGRSRRLPRDFVPPGDLELLSTGEYVITPVSALGGHWQARGRRGIRHQVDPAPVEALFQLAGAPFAVTRVNGGGSADRRLTRIRGHLTLHARLLTPPGAAFRMVLGYRGNRRAEPRTPGRVPLIPPS
jgi:hypothetical protein